MILITTKTNHSYLIVRIYCFIFVSIFFSSASNSSEEIPKVSNLKEVTCEKSLFQSVHNKHCYRLNIAENPGTIDTRYIEVNILKISALKSQSSTPLFIIAGGPGQSATKLAPELTWIFRETLQNRDLIFVDQRGTGLSNPLNCELETRALASSTQLQHKRFLGELKLCIDGFDADLRFYSTIYAVDDLETIRKQLGLKKILLWGASYGTRVALEYSRKYPSSIEAMILDGVAPYENSIPNYLLKDSSLVLQKIFDLCDKQKPCKAAFPNLRNSWKELVEKLKRSPETHHLTHPRTQEKKEVFIDAITISVWLRAALYVRDLLPIVPYAIHQAANQNFEILFGFNQLSENLHENISIGMQLAVLCSEGKLTQTSENKLAENNVDHLFYFNEKYEMQEICGLFPLFNLDPSIYEPIKSATPALILSGDLDPATPPYWANKITANLTHAEHYVIAGAHHGVTSLPCIPTAIEHFIKHNSLAKFDTSCFEKIQPQAFFIDGAGPKMKLEKEFADDD